MATASDNTFDLDPPRRPSLDDCGGATKLDDLKYPPNPVTMPTAAEWNLFTKFHERVMNFLPHTRVHVAIVAGTPTIQSVQSFRSSVTAETFDVTDNADGDTVLAWDADTFTNPALCPTSVRMVSDGAWRVPIAVDSTNQVQVLTRDDSGALTDGDFVIELY